MKTSSKSPEKLFYISPYRDKVKYKTGTTAGKGKPQGDSVMKKKLFVLLLCIASMSAFSYELKNCGSCQDGNKICEFWSNGKNVGKVSVHCEAQSV
jgi:hypothetical protein